MACLFLSVTQDGQRLGVAALDLLRQSVGPNGHRCLFEQRLTASICSLPVLLARGVGLLLLVPYIRRLVGRLCISDGGFVLRFLLGWRFPCGNHLLDFAQSFVSFRQCDPSDAVMAEGDGLLPAVDRVVVAE